MRYLLLFSKFTIGAYATEQEAKEALATRLAYSPDAKVKAFLEKTLLIVDTEATSPVKPFPRTLNELKIYLRDGGK